MRIQTKIARLLRQQQTNAEATLWGYLRNRKFDNLKFRRQHSIKEYIVDFINFEHQLIIELDGGYHNSVEQKEKDELRDLHLKNLGYVVLRFKNNIVFDEHELILSNIKKTIENKKSLPLPKGEGWGEGANTTILSTKKLTLPQKELLLNSGIGLVEYNAIQIEEVKEIKAMEAIQLPRSKPKRQSEGNFFLHFDETSPGKLNSTMWIKNAIFTSKNSAKAIQNSKLKIENCYCVGAKTKKLMTTYGFHVIEVGTDATDLAQKIVQNHQDKTFVFFCGNQRREELPTLLKKHQIAFTEQIVYYTHQVKKQFDRVFDGVLFFSPSAVQSYTASNPIVNSIAFCIGNTTASEAKKHTKNVIVATKATIENVIIQSVKYFKY